MHCVYTRQPLPQAATTRSQTQPNCAPVCRRAAPVERRHRVRPARAASPAHAPWSVGQEGGKVGMAGEAQGAAVACPPLHPAPAQPLLHCRSVPCGTVPRCSSTDLSGGRRQPLKAHDIVDAQGLKLQHSPCQVAALHLRHCTSVGRQADAQVVCDTRAPQPCEPNEAAARRSPCRSPVSSLQHSCMHAHQWWPAACPHSPPPCTTGSSAPAAPGLQSGRQAGQGRRVLQKSGPCIVRISA